MRCLTLAQQARAAGATCTFVCRALPGHMADRIHEFGFEVFLLPAPHGQTPIGPPRHASWACVAWHQDAKESRRVLETVQPDWLVLDHYAFDERWQNVVVSEGVRLMVIDDLADRTHNCDFLLDQNIGHSASKYEELLPDRCVQYFGPRYALLRSEFPAARAKSLANREGRGLQNILITMGGVDSIGATYLVLAALRECALRLDLVITVVMGQNAPNKNRVRALARDMPWQTDVVVDVKDMAARMSTADLAISAGGSTTWERCCLGLPSIIVETAWNQAGIARRMAAEGAAIDPGPLQSVDFAAKLQAALIEASEGGRLSALSSNAASLCDGYGAERIVNRIYGD